MKKLLTGLLILLSISTLSLAKEISTYDYAKLQSAQSIKTALTSNGLSVVGEYDAMGDKDYHVIVYTSDALKKSASLKNRGFGAVQKVLISQKDKRVVLTNPEYFLHAFLQDDFNKKTAQNLRAKLQNIFGKLTNSQDALEHNDIADYHFMMGMPYYEDMIEVAQGSNLLAKLKKNGGDKIVFELQVGASTLVGISMDGESGEKYYLGEITGEKHAAFLPYMVLINKDNAQILHPKYYLAISYPALSMGDFMGISGTPGDIEDYISALFK